MSLPLKESFRSTILKSTGAEDLFEMENIQRLWSGYGDIVRYGLKGSPVKSVVVKHVKFPNTAHHPRGWNSDFSHLRKLKSYEVEVAWYGGWAARCGDNCKLPTCYATEAQDDEVLIVLEDIDAVGFPVRKRTVSWTEINACIVWLANFHATFLGEQPEGLWEKGTYWHLETRPEELEALDDIPLKNAAEAIDLKLAQCTYQTFVHGDAKLANFCFSENSKKVAAVDFQYVGGGCGMKDLAYFVGSCLNENDCEKYESKLLDTYFIALNDALAAQQKMVDFDEMELEWRALYPVAWTDFHRFLKGWSPDHWKINSYSERLSREVIRQLTSES